MDGDKMRQGDIQIGYRYAAAGSRNQIAQSIAVTVQYWYTYSIIAYPVRGVPGSVDTRTKGNDNTRFVYPRARVWPVSAA